MLAFFFWDSHKRTPESEQNWYSYFQTLLRSQSCMHFKSRPQKRCIILAQNNLPILLCKLVYPRRVLPVCYIVPLSPVMLCIMERFTMITKTAVIPPTWDHASCIQVSLLKTKYHWHSHGMYPNTFENLQICEHHYRIKFLSYWKKKKRIENFKQPKTFVVMGVRGSRTWLDFLFDYIFSQIFFPKRITFF